MDRKQIAAMILGCNPRELMSYKDFGTFVSVVDPVGRKFVYTNEHLQDAAQRSELATKNVATAKKVAAPGQPGSKKIAVPSAALQDKPAKKTVTGGQVKAKKIATTKPTTKGAKGAKGRESK